MTSAQFRIESKAIISVAIVSKNGLTKGHGGGRSMPDDRSNSMRRPERKLARLTSQERDDIETEERISKFLAREHRFFTYSLKSYKKFYPSKDRLKERDLYRLRVLLGMSCRLYGGGWSTLSLVMKTRKSVLIKAFNGKAGAATYALAVFVAELSGMTEELFFSSEEFKPPLSGDMDLLDRFSGSSLNDEEWLPE